jgi:lambda repressor-like predicted transcriptional regulator
MANHGQTLAQLAERGGLSLSEAAALALRRKWEPMPAEAALAALKGAAERYVPPGA